MSLRRARRTAAFLFAVSLIVLGIGVYAARDYLTESWCLMTLRKAKSNEIEGLLESLAKVGGCRSAAYCIDEEIGSGRAVKEYAGTMFYLGPGVPDTRRLRMKTLSRIAPRLSSTDRKNFVSLLLERAASDEASCDPLFELARSSTDACRQGLNALGRGNIHLAQAMAAAALERYAVSPGEIIDALRRAPPEVLVDFFLAACLDPERGIAIKTFDAAQSLASRLPPDNPDPRARAVLLSFQIIHEGEGRNLVYELAPAAAAYDRDSSMLVKIAALRMSACLGPRNDGVDLKRVLLKEDNAEILTAAVEGRELWVEGGDFTEGFELYPGRLCYWIPRHEKRNEMPWTKEELARLETILSTRRETALRDAASHALASRYRRIRIARAPEPAPVRIRGFRAAEWGVWIDNGGRLEAPSKLLSDLPSFVHRSEVSNEEYEAERPESPSEVLKPVVFFHVPHPLTLLFKVHFHGGRPWTYYPDATGLHFSETGVDSRPIAQTQDREPWPELGIPADSIPFPLEIRVHERESTTPLIEKRGTNPPWARPSAKLELPRSRDRTELAGFTSFPREPRKSPGPYFAHVPWILDPDRSQQRPLGSIGLEWCGLRIGYPEALEATAPSAGGSAWWLLAREAGASRVSLRGDSDQFLFYDGVVDMPGPVHVGWASASKAELVVGARVFEEYPDALSEGEVHDAWWLTDAEKNRARAAVPLPFVFVIEKRDGALARGAVLEGLDPEAPPRTLSLANLDLAGAQLFERFESSLKTEGLDSVEARSLVKTWEKELFEVSGLRAATIMPRWMYDSILPCEMFPVPESFARVGVVLRDLKNLEIGTSSWGLEDSEARWTPRRCRFTREKRQLEWEAFTPGEPAPLELGSDRAIKIDRGKLCEIAISADGLKLAYTIFAHSKYEVWLADLERRELRLVDRFTGEGLLEGSTLFLDGKGARIVYEVDEGEEPTFRCTFIADLNTGRRLELKEAVAKGISADGKKLLIFEELGASQILKALDLDSGKDLRVFSSSNLEKTPSVSLSGDGRRVAIDVHERLFVADLSTSALFGLSGRYGPDTKPVLSHDGAKVVFESERKRDVDVYLADFNARRFENLTHGLGIDRRPSFLDDSRSILFFESIPGAPILLDLSTGSKKRIDSADGFHGAVTSNGRRVGFKRSLGEPAEECVVVRDL